MASNPSAGAVVGRAKHRLLDHAVNPAMRRITHAIETPARSSLHPHCLQQLVGIRDGNDGTRESSLHEFSSDALAEPLHDKPLLAHGGRVVGAPGCPQAHEAMTSTAKPLSQSSSAVVVLIADSGACEQRNRAWAKLLKS